MLIQVVHLFHYDPLYDQARKFNRTLKFIFMPQKSHEQAASHHEEAAKHHRNAAKYASEGNHEKAAQHAQAAQGHSRKAQDYSNRAAEKYAEKAGTLKSEGNQKEMHRAGNSHN
jgi:hypothetical protein